MYVKYFWRLVNILENLLFILTNPNIGLSFNKGSVLNNMKTISSQRCLRFWPSKVYPHTPIDLFETLQTSSYIIYQNCVLNIIAFQRLFKQNGVINNILSQIKGKQRSVNPLDSINTRTDANRKQDFTKIVHKFVKI